MKTMSNSTNLSTFRAVTLDHKSISSSYSHSSKGFMTHLPRIDTLTNFSNLTDLSQPSNSMSLQIAAAVIYSIVAIAGLAGYFLYCCVVVKNRRTLSNAFYALTVSLAVPECLANMLTLIYGLPAMTATRSGAGIDLGWVNVRYIFGFLCDYAWFAICAHLVLIACNRLIALKWPMNYNRLFSKRNTALALTGSYSCAIVVPIITYALSCRYEFAQLSWFLSCDADGETHSQVGPMIDSIWSNSQIAFVLFCNAFILIYVRKKRLKLRPTSGAPPPQSSFGQPPRQNRQQPQAMVRDQKAKRERSLIWQFTAIAVVLILTQITFWVLPVLSAKNYVSDEISGFFSQLMVFLTYSINPFLYFTFSSEIRRRLLRKEDTTKAERNAATTLAKSIFVEGAV